MVIMVDGWGGGLRRGCTPCHGTVTTFCSVCSGCSVPMKANIVVTP